MGTELKLLHCGEAFVLACAQQNATLSLNLPGLLYWHPGWLAGQAKSHCIIWHLSSLTMAEVLSADMTRTGAGPSCSYFPDRRSHLSPRLLKGATQASCFGGKVTDTRPQHGAWAASPVQGGIICGQQPGGCGVQQRLWKRRLCRLMARSLTIGSPSRWAPSFALHAASQPHPVRGIVPDCALLLKVITAFWAPAKRRCSTRCCGRTTAGV